MSETKASPNYLPQVNAPFNIVVDKLRNNNVNYIVKDGDPNELSPSQSFTFSDDVENVDIDSLSPIWISNDNKIIDGHHRWVRSILDNKPIKIIQLDLNYNEAVRLLNKIMDIYEYEQQMNMEEVVTQDAINFNYDNDINSENIQNEGEVETGNSLNDFLSTLEEDNNNIKLEIPSNNNKKIVAYRNTPISEKSVVGNFFILKPMDGYDKYEIEFDNLLDTDDLGLVYRQDQKPVEILSKIWYPHVNFEKLSELYNIPSINLKNKVIAEKARNLGFDGIKYGNSIVQGLN